MPSTVATITFENPSDLITNENGAETQGQAYTLSVPSLATEPLTVTAPNGECFSWQPQMLLYHDEFGIQDFIIESMPSDLTILGRQARYLRTFANADDVFHAESDKVKHWTVLNEPPRSPAEYLSGVIQFGISGIIKGTELPEGIQDSITSGIFVLPQPVIKDLTGQEITGYYEVISLDEGQQLNLWFDSSFLNRAVYPVMVDPTIVTNHTYDLSYNSARKIVKLSNGWLICMAYDGNSRSYYVYKSTDKGNTWTYLSYIQFGTSPLGAINGGSMVANGNTVTFIIPYVGSSASSVFSTTIDITTINAVTNLTSINFVRVVDVANGIFATSCAIDKNGVIYASWIGKGDYSSFCQNAALKISKDNGTTWTNLFYITQFNTNGRNVTSISMTAAPDNFIYVAYSYCDEYGYYYIYAMKYDITGATNVSFLTINNLATTYYRGNVIAICDSLGNLHVFFEYKSSITGSYTNLAYTNVGKGGGQVNVTASNTNYYDSPSVCIDSNNVIYLFCESSEPTYGKRNVGYQKYTGGSWGAFTWLTTNGGITPNAIENAGDSMVCWIYGDGVNIDFDKIILNQPPLAPTLTPQQNFDATQSTTFSWTFNDPDIGNTQSAFQLQIIKVSDGSIVKDTGKIVSTSSTYTLPANVLSNTQQYQWKVMTWDNSDVASPWSTLGTFNTYAPSTCTVTNPTDGATIQTSSITVNWNFNDNQGLTQNAYQVKLTDNADAVLFDSGKVADSNARALTINYALNNNTSYKSKVTLWNSGGIQSAEVVRTFSTSFTPPATPIISSTQDNIRGAITLSINNPLPALSQTLDFTGKVAGDTTGNPNIAKYTANTALQTINATYTYNNVVTNGDFSNGITGWASGYGSLTVSNNIATITANGSLNAERLYQQTSLPYASGKKIYLRTIANVTNSVCTSLKHIITDSSGLNAINGTTLNTPNANQDYTISSLITLTTNSTTIRCILDAYYADATVANGKVMQVKQVMVVDLTALYGAGNEPTSLAWCDANLPFVATSGTTSSWAEISQSNYTQLATLDNNSYSVSTTTNGVIPQQMHAVNLIRAFENVNGTIPCTGTDTASKVNWLKNNLSRIQFNWYGYGSCSTGNKAYMLPFNTSTSAWYTNWQLTTTASSPAFLNRGINSPDISQFIDSNGMMYYLAYTDAARTTDSTFIVISNNGILNGDLIENMTRGGSRQIISVPSANTVVLSSAITGQVPGDVINKFHKLLNKTAGTNTTTTTLIIPNHGLSTGDWIYNYTKGGWSKVTVVDTNTITCQTAITSQVAGDTIIPYHYYGQQTAESTVIPSTIYCDYVSLDITYKPSIQDIAKSVINDVYRKGTNELNWIRIAKGIVNNGNFTDYTPANRQNYQYKITGIGSNGTTADSDSINTSVTFRDAQLSLASDYTQYVNLVYNPSRQQKKQVERVMMQFAGRENQVAEFGEHGSSDLSLSFSILSIDDLNTLQSLIDSRQILLYRDNRGRRIFCTIDSIDVVDEIPNFWTVSFTINKTSYQEAV